MVRASVQKIERMLLVTLQDDATSTEAEDLLTQVGETVVATLALGVLIDVSGLSLVDSYMARALDQLVGMTHILGAEAIIAGIRPEVAIAMVELGIELPGIATALTVDLALANLRRRIGLRT